MILNLLVQTLLYMTNNSSISPRTWMIRSRGYIALYTELFCMPSLHRLFYNQNVFYGNFSYLKLGMVYSCWITVWDNFILFAFAEHCIFYTRNDFAFCHDISLLARCTTSGLANEVHLTNDITLTSPHFPSLYPM